MNMQTAIIEITPAMEPYVNKRDMWLKQRAMILYPYIQNGTISHGRAAEILEMDKWSLIQLYGSMGIPYIDMDEAELERDIANALAACGESK
jgi:hypothetical protein